MLTLIVHIIAARVCKWGEKNSNFELSPRLSVRVCVCEGGLRYGALNGEGPLSQYPNLFWAPIGYKAFDSVCVCHFDHLR